MAPNCMIMGFLPMQHVPTNITVFIVFDLFLIKSLFDNILKMLVARQLVFSNKTFHHNIPEIW